MGSHIRLLDGPVYLNVTMTGEQMQADVVEEVSNPFKA